MRQPQWGCITVMYAGAAVICREAMSDVALSVATCTLLRAHTVTFLYEEIKFEETVSAERCG